MKEWSNLSFCVLDFSINKASRSQATNTLMFLLSCQNWVKIIVDSIEKFSCFASISPFLFFFMMAGNVMNRANNTVSAGHFLPLPGKICQYFPGLRQN